MPNSNEHPASRQRALLHMTGPAACLHGPSLPPSQFAPFGYDIAAQESSSHGRLDMAVRTGGAQHRPPS